MQSNLIYKNEIHSQMFLNVLIKRLEPLVLPPSRLVTTVYLIYPFPSPESIASFIFNFLRLCSFVLLTNLQ